MIREVGSSDGRVLDLAAPLKWLPDGSIIGFNDGGRLAVSSPVTSVLQRVVAPGPVIDTRSELRRTAFDPEDSNRSVVDVSSDLCLLYTSDAADERSSV